MPTQLALAAVGAGKTEHVLAQIDALTTATPFARVWVLLATERQVSEFRRRLIEDIGEQGVFFNVEFFTFYELYARILDMAGQPTRKLDYAARVRLLRVLAGRLVARGELAAFAQIADKPGFLSVLTAFIDELKQGLATPADFEAVTAAAFGGRGKDAALARLYGAYQDRLRAHDVVDREGEGWLALEALARRSALCEQVDLLVVDGYDQFTPLQAGLVAGLAAQVGQALVTLTTVPARGETVGRRFADAQKRLQAAHTQAAVSLRVETLTRPDTEQRHPALQHLVETIFLPDAAKRTAAEALRLRSAPDVAAESAAVLREVKALLLGVERDAVLPDEILIVLRAPEQYQVHLRTLGRAYGLPLAFHTGLSLADMPPVLLLMDVITLHDERLHVTDFPTRVLLDVLRSPYCTVAGLGTDEIAELDRIAREFAVVGGAAAWLDAIDAAARPRLADDDDDTRERPALIGADTRDALKAALGAFFDAVTPPARATLADYVAWVDGVIGDDPAADPDDDTEPGPAGVLRMVAQARDGHAPGYVVNRDVDALNEFKGVLRGMLSAELLLDALGEADGALSWRRFLGDLRTAVAGTSAQMHPTRSGRVLVTTAADARGLPHDYVFVLGLAEGVFPRRLPEDPLYLDSERRQMVSQGLAVQTDEMRAADDSFFYEIISLARRRLTLSRPTVKNGAPWVESHLWRAVMDRFSDAAAIAEAGRQGIGEGVPLAATASASEAALAVSVALRAPDTDDGALPGAYNWLWEQAADVWGNAVSGRGIEARRWQPDVAYDPYTGVITAPPLRTMLSEHILGPSRRWSASQFNDYGICPFHFYAKRILKLEELDEPQVGMDALQRGLLNHYILQQTYTRLAETNTQIHAPNLDGALAVLDEQAGAILSDAPERFGFRASPVWEQEKAVLLESLRQLVAHDFTDLNKKIAKEFGVTAPRFAYQTETAFGIGGQGMLFEMADGSAPIYVNGYIDRIDRCGGRALVIDYKTGSKHIGKDDLVKGRNFQVMLYAQALQGILDAQTDADGPTDVMGGFFYHISNASISGVLNLHDAEHQTNMQHARNHITRTVRRARAGDFAVAPSDPDFKTGRCVSYCPFQALCRVAVTRSQKPDTHL